MERLEEMKSCTRCALSRSRQRVVVGSGPEDPALVVIGEAPGREEDEGGEPFIGRSGRLLFRLIDEEVGLARARCFVTNVVKCRPPDNRTPTTHEISACRPWLEGQLAALAPAPVLTLGLTAARAVLGLAGPMATLHGRVIRRPSLVGLATYHPAAALRGGETVVATMREDLRALRVLLEAA